MIFQLSKGVLVHSLLGYSPAPAVAPAAPPAAAAAASTAAAAAPPPLSSFESHCKSIA